MSSARGIAWLAFALSIAALAIGLAFWWRGTTSKDPLPPRLAQVAPLCLKASEVFCKKLEGCGGLAAEQLSACIERRAADCEADIGWRLRKGILLLNREAEEECVEGLEAAQCGAVISVLGDDDQDILELTDRCELDELRPGSGIGAPCALPTDCKEGTCPYAESGCHTCRAWVPVGATCSIGGDSCDPAIAYCSRAPDGGHCTRLKLDGMSCALAEECHSAICRLTTSGARQCAPQSEAIDCSDSRDCAERSFCRAIERGGRCEERVKSGSKCIEDAHQNVCLESEARCVAGRCQVRPFSEPEGARCRDLTDCQAGLYCRWRDGPGGEGICTRQSPADGPCRATDYGSCVLSTRCVGGACRTLGARGERCSGPYQCKGELECTPGSSDAGFAGGATCLEPLELGGSCGAYRSCRDGYCRMDGGAGVCVPKSPAGASCQVQEECASNRCQAASSGGPSQCQGPCG